MSSSEDILRSQFVTLEKGRGKHRKYLPNEKNEPVANCDRFRSLKHSSSTWSSLRKEWFDCDTLPSVFFFANDITPAIVGAVI